MDLNLTPQETAFRDEVRAWFAENVPKDWVKRRNEEESMEARFGYLRAWQKKMFDAGWAGVAWAKEYGGRGATLMEQVVFIEEMVRAEAPPMANVLGLGLIGPTIIAFGSEAQKHLARSCCGLRQITVIEVRGVRQTAGRISLIGGESRVAVDQLDPLERYAKLFGYQLRLRGDDALAEFDFAGICRHAAIVRDGNP